MTFAEWRKALLALGWTEPVRYGKQLQSPANANGDFLVLKLAYALDTDASSDCVLRLRGGAATGEHCTRLLPTPKTLQAMLNLLSGLEIIGVGEMHTISPVGQWLLLGQPSCHFAVRIWGDHKLLVVSPQDGESAVLYDMRAGTSQAWSPGPLGQREFRAVADCQAPDTETEDD